MSVKKLSRRVVLRGLGTAIAMPFFEAMMPLGVTRGEVEAETPPNRMAFLYVPNGMHMPDWTPVTEGQDFELSPTLSALANHRKQMTVLSGLTLDGARAHGDGGGDHARSVASYLTGAHPKKTDGADINNGISVDQVAAEKIGSLTRFGSLELGLERSAPAGRCDSGYSCVYTSNMSWRSATSPVAKEINPQAVFDRLFGSGEKFDEARSRQRRARDRKSVLDFALDDAQQLRRRLGYHDKQKLDEYLFAVRTIEQRIVDSEKLIGREEFVPDFPRPAGVPRKLTEHLEVMFDLMALAFQTDSTRVISFMYANAGSNRGYPEIGAPDGHHNLSHHGKDPEKQAKISSINRFHVEQLSYLLDRFSEIQEPTGSLLDNSMLMYGSGISDGDRHNHDDLPIVLFGKGAGSIAPGGHIRYENGTPLANLYVSLLDRMGANVDAFSDSTAALPRLSG